MLVDALAIVLVVSRCSSIRYTFCLLYVVGSSFSHLTEFFSSFGLSLRTHRYLCADPNCHRANPND